MTWLRSSWLLWSIALLVGCEPVDLIHNPKVQRWCDDRPCGWSVDRGRIERVGSWHSHDYAVAFVDDDTQLSQLNATVSNASASCFAFTMIAKVEPDVRMFLELDFFDDGEVEFSERLRETDWEQLRFLITPPRLYRGVRFIVRKDGPGRAELGQLSALEGSDCTAVPLEVRNLPPGWPCELDNECRDGVCASGICGACDDDGDCAATEICGLEPGAFGYRQACVAPGFDDFGARCSMDAECQSGICCEGACSQCCSEAGCTDGQPCVYPEDWYDTYGPAAPSRDPEVEVHWPKQCGSGTGATPPDELCSTDADCASGRCRGSSRECEIDYCEQWLCAGVCLQPRVYGGVCE